MYSVDELLIALNTRIPTMRITVQHNNLGNAWVDLPKGHSIEVIQSYGFGLHTESVDIVFGENPNEVYNDVDSLITRISELYV
jgi:hypothetical protein